MEGQYSVYQKVTNLDDTTEWVGVHRLSISAALEALREFRDRGYRVALRRDDEPPPSYKD